MYTHVTTFTAEWDEAKRAGNLLKHGLDLARGAEILAMDTAFTFTSPRGDEERFVTIGLLDDRFVALIWMMRDQRIRLISLRRARDAEKSKYRERYG